MELSNGSPGTAKSKLLLNLWGGAGCGKTTLAADLFVTLKKKNILTELISEYAKDIILEGNKTPFTHQWYVGAQQAYRIHCAYQTMQVVITDSPFIQACVYEENIEKARHQTQLALEYAKDYNSFNILISRNPNFDFQLQGRHHTIEQSKYYDSQIYRFLLYNNIPYTVYGDEGVSFDELVTLILKRI